MPHHPLPVLHGTSGNCCLACLGFVEALMLPEWQYLVAGALFILAWVLFGLWLGLWVVGLLGYLWKGRKYGRHS